MDLDSNTVKSIKSEFNLLKTLHHPRIVNFLGFYCSKTSCNFILEYMVHGSLDGVFERYNENQWKFGEYDLLWMFMDIAIGVKFLHSKGIMHRDLKPANILVDKKYRLKIADFGIAKIAQNALENHTVIGTRPYMAPEALLKLPYDHKADSRCDFEGSGFFISLSSIFLVWSLGLIFYEMAMLRPPFNSVGVSNCEFKSSSFY